MSVESIFNENTILSYRNIKVGGYDLPDDEIITYELKHDFFSFEIVGRIQMKDSFDMFNKKIVSLDVNTTIVISMSDFLGDIYYRTFRIVDTKSEIRNGRFKVYTISFIDEVTFRLSTAYIGKGYLDTPVKALFDSFRDVGVDIVMKNDKLGLLTDPKLDEKVEKHNFIVPQHIDHLHFFTNYLRKYNIRLWQDRKNIYINEVKPADLSIMENTNKNVIIYTNDTLDQEYMFKIHDFHQYMSPSGQLNALKPFETIYRFTKDKTIVNETINLSDVLGEMQLNNKDPNASKIKNAPPPVIQQSTQSTTGSKLGVSAADTIGGQKANLFDIYMQTNKLLIAVPGSFRYSQPGKLIKVALKGNPLYNDSALEGDRVSSGLYFVSHVTDRMIGDKLIQRLVLNRIDQQLPRKTK